MSFAEHILTQADASDWSDGNSEVVENFFEEHLEVTAMHVVEVINFISVMIAHFFDNVLDFSQCQIAYAIDIACDDFGFRVATIGL